MSVHHLMRVSEVGEALGIEVSPFTPMRWIRKGVGGERLPSVKIGGRIFVDPVELQAFVERLNAQPGRTPLTVRPARSAGRKSSGVSKSPRGETTADTEEKLNRIFGKRRPKNGDAPEEGGTPTM